MSVQDCITDSMYKPVLLNADAINMPHLSGAQLHCHAGVVTATNYILSDLNRHQILHKVFFGNNCKMDDSTLSKSAPYLVGETQTERESWTLVLCGHSLGAAGYFKTYAYGESNLLAGYFPQNLQHHAENGP
jgi:sn1-specific diacylglycerol lipase